MGQGYSMFYSNLSESEGEAEGKGEAGCVRKHPAEFAFKAPER